MQTIQIDRVWSMPSKHTFKIKPIQELIDKEIEITSGLWIEAFANESKLALITNDLNPAYDMDYHLEAFKELILGLAWRCDGKIYCWR